MRPKAIRRLAVPGGVGNATWGSESRALAIATHALCHGAINCGVAVTGFRASGEDIPAVDSSTPATVAGEVARAGFASCGEIPRAWAVTGATLNRQILKTAKMLVRVRRATRATEQSGGFSCVNRYSPTLFRQTQFTRYPRGLYVFRARQLVLES